MSRAVVVLPLVPVITIAPWLRSSVSRVRIRGSIARATSPGRVVPPPRRVILLSAPVALPARTAAVFLNIGASRRGGSRPGADRAGHRGPAVEVLDALPSFFLVPDFLEELGAEAPRARRRGAGDSTPRPSPRPTHGIQPWSKARSPARRRRTTRVRTAVA